MCSHILWIRQPWLLQAWLCNSSSMFAMPEWEEGGGVGQEGGFRSDSNWLEYGLALIHQCAHTDTHLTWAQSHQGHTSNPHKVSNATQSTHSHSHASLHYSSTLCLFLAHFIYSAFWNNSDHFIFFSFYVTALFKIDYFPPSLPSISISQSFVFCKVL